MTLLVIEGTRGHITLRSGARTVTVCGELLGRSPGLPDYQVYGDSIRTWDKPNDDEQITPDEKQAILAEVCDYLRSEGRIPVVLDDSNCPAERTE